MAAPFALLAGAGAAKASTPLKQESNNQGNIDITKFGGGVGASAEINFKALETAKKYARGGKIVFPHPGAYDFPSGTSLTGFVMSPVHGVVIRGPASLEMVTPDIITDNDFRVFFDSGVPKNYYIDIRANFHNGSKGANKSLWLSSLEIENKKLSPVDPRNIHILQFSLGDKYEFIRVLPAGYTDRTLYLTPPAGGNCHAGFIPAVPGKELIAGVNNVPNNNGEVVAGFIFNEGYAMLRGAPASGKWILTTKKKSRKPTHAEIHIDGGKTRTYSPGNNLMTVRSISPVHGQVLVNGVVAADIKIKAGALQWMGIGSSSMDDALVSSSNLNGWYTSEFHSASSPKSQTLGVIGDSISDREIHGTWAPWCAEALDGTMGIRINDIENRAISGQTLQQQIDNLKKHPFVNASIVAIFIGTNDIQGDNTLADFQNSLTGILNKLDSMSLRQVLVIPPQWYMKSETKGEMGGETTNSNRGGDIRAAIGRIAADRDLQLVDMTRVTGAVNPDYLTSSFADSMLRDNLHPTAYAYRIYGYEIAKSIAAELCPVVDMPSKWIDVQTLSEGVSGILRYRYTVEGVQLSGEINIARPANGVIARLPLNIAPPAIRRFVTWGTNDLIKTAINTDGTIEVINSGSSVISMDNITITY